MVGTHATELPLCPFPSDRRVDVDGIVAALFGAAALIHSCDEGGCYSRRTTQTKAAAMRSAFATTGAEAIHE